MSVIHWYHPGPNEHGADSRNEVRISIHDSDDVADIACRLIGQIRSNGHHVVEKGGDYTGPDGTPIGLWFDVIVSLDGMRTMLWEHAVCFPSEVWRLAPATGGDAGDAAREFIAALGRAGWIDTSQCPTCSGPNRETVGLVCQTCGHDYGSDA